jgi:hypothetical protein
MKISFHEGNHLLRNRVYVNIPKIIYILLTQSTSHIDMGSRRMLYYKW